MQQVSDRFNEAVFNAHTLATNVMVEGTELPIADGSVTLDALGSTRASVSLTLAPDNVDLDALVPGDGDSLLAPYGNEISVARGITFSDGSTELVPLGVFRLDETQAQDDGGLGITVVGLDRSSIVIDAVFENGGEVAAGEYGVDVITDLIRDGRGEEPPAFPDVELADDFPTSSTVTTTMPALYWEAGSDRWDFCQGIAQACNCHLYFNALGKLVLRREPLLGQADLTISEGDSLLEASSRWSRENACNRVVVIGENAGGDPVVGTAFDNDSLSPTYYYGDFGKVTFTYSSEYITDTDQAADVAENILGQKLGTGKQITFGALVHPALEPLDIVQVTRERLKVNELHILDSLTIPLTHDGGMSGVTRIKRVAPDG